MLSQPAILPCKGKTHYLHFRPENNFAGEHVFCSQSVWDLRIIFRFDIIIHEGIESESWFFCSGCTANRKRAFLRNYFRGGNADNGFFLCTAEWGQLPLSPNFETVGYCPQTSIEKSVIFSSYSSFCRDIIRRRQPTIPKHIILFS